MSELDPLDQRIFGLLAENGRMSNLELAGHVGVSEKTVRQRIRRLTERDGMRIGATLARSAARSRLIVLVRAESGQRFAVAHRLSALPEVDEVHMTTGNWELVVMASFNSDSDALTFYVNHVERAAGIDDSRSTHIVETISSKTGESAAVFEQFGVRASSAESLPELLDLVCDAATELLGADRVHVSADDSWLTGPDARSWTKSMRWRGLSSRYVEEIRMMGRDSALTVPNVVRHHQHLFVADAQTDPLFESISHLVASEGYHSWFGMPVRNGDTLRGTLCLYWNGIITYREDLGVRSQELADILGKHLARFGNEQTDAVPDESELTGASHDRGGTPRT
ncbi:AsnC family transcriptional regulator [Streptomyces sp. NPDC059455]|uniref:AsnC family transcriptional regulator n=1 Tax=Streptomyces sp. NPDC059455 TaxID=3346837 RepID=UPI0036C2273A